MGGRYMMLSQRHKGEPHATPNSGAKTKKKKKKPMRKSYILGLENKHLIATDSETNLAFNSLGKN